MRLGSKRKAYPVDPKQILIRTKDLLRTSTGIDLVLGCRRTGRTLLLEKFQKLLALWIGKDSLHLFDECTDNLVDREDLVRILGEEISTERG